MPSLSKEAALVHEALVARGLETPLRPPVHEMDNETRKSLIAGHMTEIMQLLNLDLADDSLMETPHRIAKMYVDEIFSGLDYANFPKITLIENKMKVDEMVTVRDITLTSTCEHHFVTIDGKATVAYIPKDSVIGLSKINRIVQFFAQRPQVVLSLDVKPLDFIEDIGQHRTIRQEVSDRIFAPIQSSENGGILYVFPIFGTAEVGQKDG